MATVDIGIGHDDQFMIPEFRQIQCLCIINGAYFNAQGRKKYCGSLRYRRSYVPWLFPHSGSYPEWKYCLVTPVAALFGRSAGGVPSSTRNNSQCPGIFIGTIGQFTR